MNDRDVTAATATKGHRKAVAFVAVLKALWRPLLVISMIAVIVIVIRPRHLVQEIAEVREWIDAMGAWGVVLFLAIYVIAAVAIVPATLLKVAAGGMFGSLFGVIIASIGSTLGATVCFLIARYVAGGTLVQRWKHNRKFSKLDELTKRHGAVIVAMVRLVPILPGNLVNYAFGLTRVLLGVFVFWSWLCMLPGTVVLVVGTDAFVQGMYEDRVPWGLLSIVAVALAMMGVSMFFAHRSFKAKQDRHRDDMEYADL